MYVVSDWVEETVGNLSFGACKTIMLKYVQLLQQQKYHITVHNNLPKGMNMEINNLLKMKRLEILVILQK